VAHLRGRLTRIFQNSNFTENEMCHRRKVGVASFRKVTNANSETCDFKIIIIIMVMGAIIIVAVIGSGIFAPKSMML
jgi:hypothetical protein